MIKDIFDGKTLSVWGDEEFVSISFPFVTVDFPREEWEKVKEDLKKIGELNDEEENK